MTSYPKKRSGFTFTDMLVAVTVATAIIAAIGLRSLSGGVLSERSAEPNTRFSGRFRQEERPRPSSLRPRVSLDESGRR